MTFTIQHIFILCAAAVPFAGTAAYAQDTSRATPTTLTIDQAVALARRNNPDFLATRNNERAASAQLRSAYGGLLPQLDASLSGQYLQGGRQFISGVALGANTDAMQSIYNIGLTYRLNAATFIAPRVQRANSKAVAADVAGAAETLDATVRQNYLTALQSRAQVELQDSLVANTQTQLELAQAKAQVGTGTQLDVRRAEIALGQQRVAQLKARNQHDVDKLRLYQQIGVQEPAQLQLVSTFGVHDSLPQLPPLSAVLTLARQRNPSVVALRAREHVADLNVTREHAEYTPTLSISTGIGGYTYQYRDPSFLVDQAQAQTDAARASCIATQEVRQAVGLPNTLPQCAALIFTPQDAAQLRASNEQFPFKFTPAPKSISATLSLPLFDGFAREQRVEEAQVAREDARYNVRAKELALTADVSAAYLTLEAARQTVALQAENAAKAREELQFVQDEYAVGLATFVDLTTSRAAYAQAEADHINAVYDYYKSVAALESAVGRPLH